MESESKNIIQTLRNVKGMIELSVERKCWSQEELTELKITYHNIYEIIKIFYSIFNNRYFSFNF